VPIHFNGSLVHGWMNYIDTTSTMIGPSTLSNNIFIESISCPIRPFMVSLGNILVSYHHGLVIL
jgi:hypothetical protein